jgi:hypothetical protein
MGGKTESLVQNRDKWQNTLNTVVDFGFQTRNFVKN